MARKSSGRTGPGVPRRRVRVAGAAFFFAAAGWLSPVRLQAQLNSDAVALERTVPAQDQLKSQMSESRFRLGPFRFIPGFNVTNAGYNSNLFGTNKDPVGAWTATFSLGSRLIAPLGSKVFFVADVFPSYTWYPDYPVLSSFGGVARASIVGFFNRFSFELGGSGFQGVVSPSAEQPAPTLEKSGNGFARVEVDLTSHMAVFGGFEAQKVRQTQESVPPTDQVNAALNDRTDEAVNGGLRYTLGGDWTIAPEVAYSTSRFELTPEERNNKSIAYLLGVDYKRPRLFINLVGGYREGRPYQGSSFPSYSTPVGAYFLSYFLRPWLEIRSYGRRQIAYSVSVSNPYYFGNKIGGGLNIQVLRNLMLRCYAETGQNKYPIPELYLGREVDRLDRLLNYGGGFSAIVYKRVTLTAIMSRKKDDSNIAPNSYSTIQYSTYLTFNGEFMR